MKKTKSGKSNKIRKVKKSPIRTEDNKTGTYVYDKKLKRVVKISSRIPSIKGGNKEFDPGDLGGMGDCGSNCGTCPMQGAGFN